MGGEVVFITPPPLPSPARGEGELIHQPFPVMGEGESHFSVAMALS